MQSDNDYMVLVCRMEVWPGYMTAIARYEPDVLLVSDISHKVMRTDTVYEFMHNIYSQKREKFIEECQRQLVGQIVLTK